MKNRMTQSLWTGRKGLALCDFLLPRFFGICTLCKDAKALRAKRRILIFYKQA